MDYNNRAKKSPFNIEEDIDILKEKTKGHLELRKKHNYNIIMTERRKRVLSVNENTKENKNESFNFKNENKNIILDSDLPNEDLYLFNESNEYKIYLYNESDIKIQLPPLSNISDNIQMILEYLSSDDTDKIKCIIYSLRKYFSNNDIEVFSEYSILFENKIHTHLENIINKHKDNYYIINEIFFFVSNLFSNNEIVNKYPKEYFQYFLSENFFKIYEDINILQEEDLVNSILILLRNILFEQHELINDVIYKRREFINNILIFFKQKQIVSIETINNFILFFSLLIQELQGRYIKQVNTFYLMIDIFFNMFIKINQMEFKNINIIIIKHILNIFKYFLFCKIKDKDDNDDYFVINYLFNNSDKNNISFVEYFCEILSKNSNLYFNNISILISCLNLLIDITFNATSFQIQNLINYQIFDILNCIFYYKNNYNNEINRIILQLLKISDNIIDSGFEYSLILIKSKFFENMVTFYSQNLGNNIIVDSFLNTFIRLLNYYDKQIGDNLYKRGIIKDGVFNSLQYSNSNTNEIIIIKECKVISLYLDSILDVSKDKNGYNKEDYFLCCKFKEILLSGQLNIPEDAKECIIKSDYMQLADNLY